MDIGKMAERLGLSRHTLRYYEKIGIIMDVKRDKSGNRDYTEKDCDWVQFILRLKKIMMPISEIQRYAALRYQGNETVEERRQVLLEQRRKLTQRIKELSESVRFIDQKIDLYNLIMKSQAVKAERGCAE